MSVISENGFFTDVTACSTWKSAMIRSISENGSLTVQLRSVAIKAPKQTDIVRSPDLKWNIFEY